MVVSQNKNQTGEIVYWKLSDIANIEARTANDSRAVHEVDGHQSGRSLKAGYSPTLRDHDEIK